MIMHVTIDFGAKAYYAAVSKRGVTENAQAENPVNRSEMGT